jgi:outer membrane murein-binding lipoprotein Lpp
MKKAFYFFVMTCLLAGCESKEKIQSDIDLLDHKRAELRSEIDILENEYRTLSDTLNDMRQVKAGKKKRFIIKFHLEQSHFTLDISEHIKDNLNAIDFELPVDETYYYSLKKGDRVVNNFRVGSLVMNGSFGDWKVTINDKRIAYE